MITATSYALLLPLCGAVPPTYATFDPSVNAEKVGLLDLPTEGIQVLPWLEIELLNMTASVQATALYNGSENALGWAFFYCRPNAALLTTASLLSKAYYYCGYLESSVSFGMFLSARREQVLRNRRMMAQRGMSRSRVGSVRCDPVQWIEQQIEWTRAMVNNASYPSGNAMSKFWVQVGHLMEQVQGQADGANSQLKGLLNVSFFDQYVLNLDAELGSIGKACPLGDASLFVRTSFPQQGHCSALIKITNEDLFASQVTWSADILMPARIFKQYDFQTNVSLSSYVGIISSADDFYQTSNELVIQETTNGNNNASLYNNMKPQTVAEFLRVMAATYLATSGQEWVELFSIANSGTYNNQYMVVDFKKFTPASENVKSNFQVPELQPGLLWVAEQFPCKVVSGDMTSTLAETSYWASYNLPYFPEVFNITGFEQLEQQFGSFFSYTNYARATIFRERQSAVVDLPSMQWLMRYNDWQNDSLSAIPNCTGCPGGQCNPANSPMLSIASRGDLAPSGPDTCYGPLAGYLSNQQFGAIDAKIGSWSNRETMTVHAISGPTNVQQPTFSFPDWLPVHPQTYDFPWVTFLQPRL